MSKFDDDTFEASFNPSIGEDACSLQLFMFYNECYMSNDSIQKLVRLAPYIGDDVRQGRMIGYCDRSLGSFIPSKKSFSGGAMRGALQRMGLIRATGHELFRGCVVSPNFNSEGQIVSAVGYRVSKRLPRWVDRKVYWERKDTMDFIREGLSLIEEVMYE